MGIDILFEHGIANTTGHLKVKSATVGKLNKNKNLFTDLQKIDCDCICVSGNWTPTVHLASQSGNKLKFDSESDTFLPNQSRQQEVVIGAANGSFTLMESLNDGFEQGFKSSNKITNKNITLPVHALSLIHI